MILFGASGRKLSLGSNGAYDKVTLDLNGNLGIGTTAPGAKLHVGSATISSDVAVRIETDNASTYTPALQFAWGGDVVAEADFQYDTRATTGFKIGTTAATHPMSFVISDVTKMYIQHDGKVGIGTTAPAQVLHVAGGNLSTIRNNMFGITSNTPGTGGETGVYHNAYYDTVNSREEYLVADEACKIQFINGQINFRTAAAGSADGAITWINAMGILADGNVGIGNAATSPSTKLTVQDSGGTALAKIYQTAGTVSAGHDILEVRCDDTSDAGAYNLITANRSGTDVFVVQGDGNVGIGTAAPSAILHTLVANSDYANNATGASLITESTGSQAKLVMKVGSKHAVIRTDSNGAIAITPHSSDIYLQNSTTMVVKADGNVGIGTAAPAQLLHLQKAGGAKLRLQETGAEAWDLYAAGSLLGIQQDGTYRLVIKDDGKVGIGTSAPNSPFHITTGTDQHFLIRAASTFSDGTYILSGNDSNTGLRPIQYGASTHYFMGGNVGINTTAPGAKLHVGGTATVDSTLTWSGYQKFTDGSARIIADTADGSDTKTLFLGGGGEAGQGRGAYISLYGNDHASSAGIMEILSGNDGEIQMYSGGSKRFTIANNGKVGIGTASPATTLDVNGTISSFITGTQIEVWGATSGTQVHFRAATAGANRTQLQLKSVDQVGTVELYDGGNNLKTKLVGSGVSYFTGGNVGIGTTNPSGYKLFVEGNTRLTGITDVAVNTNTNLRVNGATHSGETWDGAIHIKNSSTIGNETSNEAVIYAEGGELKCMDDDRNRTTLSSHENGKWCYKSDNTKTGRSVVIRMEDLVKAVEEHLGASFSEIIEGN